MNLFNTLRTNQNNFLSSVITESERYLPLLRQWAERGVYRTPLENSLLINYPPITAASPVTRDNYAIVKQAISRLQAALGMTLYIHIPFCTRRCSYCNYYTLSRTNVPDSYITLLERELELYRRGWGSKPPVVQSIYIGGGTPSLLSEKQLGRILRFITNSFSVQPGAEVSMEFHPEMVNKGGVKGYLKTVSALGVNRVSVGIQSLDDGVLRAINRGHTMRDAVSLLKLISKQGFSKLNFDIIYGGLPFQSMESVYETLKILLAFRPTSISKHFCEIKPGSLDFKRYNTSSALYPNWTESIRLQTLIDMLLKQHGYRKELLHMYTDSGAFFSHQKQKWGSQDTFLLGLGPGTYGWIFQHNAPRNMVMYKTFSMTGYREQVLNGLLPVERFATLGWDETARRHIQYALNYGYIDKAGLHSLLARVSSKTRKEVTSIIAKLERHELLTENRYVYKITPLGEYLSDEIKALFASQRVLTLKISDDNHAAHHWYPNVDLIKRFKKIILSGDAPQYIDPNDSGIINRQIVFS
jgi:oxygen-independent coproporphyrinogen-3 oxidase